MMNHRIESAALGAAGGLALLYPHAALLYTTPEPYELDVMRWTGLAVIVLATMRPWALRTGGDPARRMRRWTSIAMAAAVLSVFTTNPLFLIVLFASVVGAALDASVERATTAAYDLLARLQAEES